MVKVKAKETTKPKSLKTVASKQKTIVKKTVSKPKKRDLKDDIKPSEIICSFCGNTPENVRSILGTQKKYLSVLNV